MPLELPVLTVLNTAAWAQWLISEASTSKGIWLTLAKKGATEPTSLTYAQALDEALCNGWIDGQTQKRDEQTYAQRFTPRTAKSAWSQRNVAHVARLEGEGRMQTAGRVAFEAAKADGRVKVAYAGQATMEVPEELAAAIMAVPEAQATWDILTKQNRYAICHRLHALKTEVGRQKRIKVDVAKLARGETYHPQKQKRASDRVTKVRVSLRDTTPKLLRATRSGMLV